MSKESCAQFYHLLNQNLVLQEKLKQTHDQEEAFRLIVQLGQEQGYYFSLEELRATVSHTTQAVLSDEALDLVTGGVSGNKAGRKLLSWPDPLILSQWGQ
jgi:predicted ribosomally synthesized peptide with nif11-like leader